MTTSTAKTSSPVPPAPPGSAEAVAPNDITRVWDNLWRHEPTEAKDDAIIERERHSPRWARVEQEILGAFGSIAGVRTIELGSGRGDLSVLLARAGADVTLLDTSDRALEQARARFDRVGLPARYLRDDMLSDSDKTRARFDVSLSSGVIEHFRDDDRNRVLRSHFNVLRPGGMTIISVPHARCIPYRLWKTYLEWRGWWPYGMEIPYSKSEMLRRSRQVGFEEARTACMGFWQSVSDHWGKSVLHRDWDWARTTSIWDASMGLILLLIGRRPA